MERRSDSRQRQQWVVMKSRAHPPLIPFSLARMRKQGIRLLAPRHVSHPFPTAPKFVDLAVFIKDRARAATPPPLVERRWLLGIVCEAGKESKSPTTGVASESVRLEFTTRFFAAESGLALPISAGP